MSVTGEMHEKGYALIPGFLSDELREALKTNYDDKGSYRKTVVMERHRFGKGEYKYFDYPLPEPVQLIRSLVYPHLVPIANKWMEVLGTAITFPETHQQLLDRCHHNNQLKATPLILKYGPGGYNTLHQYLYGDVYFPIQAVLFLSEAGQEFTGGNFVLTEQVPRA